MASLDHVNIVVADLDRARDFYVRGIGLVPVMDRVLEGPWFERLTAMPGVRARCLILDAPGGGCRVELLEFPGRDGGPLAANSRPETIGLRHVAIRVEDLDAVLARLAAGFAAVATVIEVPRDIVAAGKRMAYVRDPDGALVELCHYGAADPGFCRGVLADDR